MRILLIEDCPITARAIELVLTGARFNVEHSATGEEGLDLAKVYEFDLILLDLALPDISGIEVLRRLRLARIDTPVLILTGSDDTEVKLRGFGSGADDYMTKPFHQQELLARIKAIVRRSNGHAQALIRAGDLVINLNAGSAEVHGKKLMLSIKEYQVLELLALRKGTTLTKETFLNHIYGGLDEPDLKVIDVFICKLRKKLADALGGKSLVETVWGRGYVLRDPDGASGEGFAASA